MAILCITVPVYIYIDIGEKNGHGLILERRLTCNGSSLQTQQHTSIQQENNIDLQNRYVNARGPGNKGQVPTERFIFFTYNCEFGGLFHVHYRSRAEM